MWLSVLSDVTRSIELCGVHNVYEGWADDIIGYSIHCFFMVEACEDLNDNQDVELCK